MSTTIIALTGRRGAGKRTAARILADMGYQRVAFADRLLAEVAAAWRLDVGMLTDRRTHAYDIPALAIGMCTEPAYLAWAFEQGLSLHEPHSPRDTLKSWSAWRTHGDLDYFVRFVDGWLRTKIGLSAERLVVTDLRYHNQLHMLQTLGAKVISINRPSLGAGRFTSAIEADAHIANTGSMDELAANLRQCPLITNLQEVGP
jgi:hypothetical protein